VKYHNRENEPILRFSEIQHERETECGKPLVLLHSLLADSCSFDGLTARLSTARRVLTIDLPGYRGTPRSTGAIPSVASDIARAPLAVGVCEGIDVLSNGYGGFVALALAQQAPSMVDRLVLLDSGRAGYERRSRD
jgi:3-oxoadipate enol-lactonase